MSGEGTRRQPRLAQDAMAPERPLQGRRKGTGMRKRWFYLGAGMLFFCVTLLAAGASAAEVRYRVKAGDSLYRIAKKFQVSADTIRTANGLAGDALKPNQALVIPAGRAQGKSAEQAAAKKQPGRDETVHIVRKGETLAGVAEAAGLSVSEIRKLNGLKTSKLRAGQRLVLAKRAAGDAQDDEDLEEAGSIETDELVLQGEERESAGPKAPVALSRWSDPAERRLFVNLVKSYEGVPYKLGGSTMRGIDCSAFTRKVYGIFSIDLPRTARDQLKCGARVGRDNLDTGDLVFFQTRKYRLHVGIFLGGSEFFHLSSRNRAGKVDHIDSAYFSSRFIGGVRLIEAVRPAKSEPSSAPGLSPDGSTPAGSPSAKAERPPGG